MSEFNCLADELDHVRKVCQSKVANSKLVTCTEGLVRVEITYDLYKYFTNQLIHKLQTHLIDGFIFFSLLDFSKSKVKSVIVVLQFPDDYPNHEVLVELRSKTLNEKLLNGLTNVCEEEARKYLGKFDGNAKACFL